MTKKLLWPKILIILTQYLLIEWLEIMTYDLITWWPKILIILTQLLLIKWLEIIMT